MVRCDLCGIEHQGEADGVCPLRVALARTVPVGQLSREERALQALSYAYGNLAASTRHKPARAPFKKVALERGLSTAAFDLWADQRRWW